MGSVPGQVAVYVVDPVLCVSIGALPPPEKLTAAGTAAGVMLPSGCTARLVSTGIQAPFRIIRVGTVVVAVVNDPSGFAVVIEVCDVSAVTSTGSPDADAAVAAVANRPGVEESTVVVSGPAGSTVGEEGDADVASCVV